MMRLFQSLGAAERTRPLLISLVLLVFFLAAWAYLTARPGFDAEGYTAKQLEVMEFNADIIRDGNGSYLLNPDKLGGFPGPLSVMNKVIEEFSDPFHKRGTNDHGIGYLIGYTVSRFAAAFVSASLFAVALGVMIGLSPVLFRAFNPFIQILKPISPLAWMPLLLYSVKDPTMTLILVVFMASLWPTVANSAFGVNSIKADHLRVSSLLQLSWIRRLLLVVLPSAAPAIVAGLRISFGSALVAVVSAEMLLGELGVGYLSWIEWNNLDISGVIFAILVVGCVGVILDTGFNYLAKSVTYTE